MKRIALIFAICVLSLALLASCAAPNKGVGETGTKSENDTEAQTVSDPSNDAGDEVVTMDKLGDEQTAAQTESRVETAATETETESETIHNIIIDVGDDEDTAMVPNGTETVDVSWELGGVPLG